MKACQAGEHFLRTRKNIAHVVKNRKADIVVKVRHTVTFGKRISRLLRNTALPPTGNPVNGSRGPA